MINITQQGAKFLLQEYNEKGDFQSQVFYDTFEEMLYSEAEKILAKKKIAGIEIPTIPEVEVEPEPVRFIVPPTLIEHQVEEVKPQSKEISFEEQARLDEIKRKRVENIKRVHALRREAKLNK